MNDENKLILKQLLTDIQKLGYKTHRSRAKNFIDKYYYKITNKITGNGFWLYYHPHYLCGKFSIGDFGFFTFTNPFIKTYVKESWLESSVVEIAQVTYKKLVAINKIDPHSLILKDIDIDKVVDKVLRRE